MDESAALSRLRLAIGNPPTQGAGVIYDYTLGIALEDALTRLFRELKCRMVSKPTMLALQEGIASYPLPPEIMSVVTVRLGESLWLLPDNIWRWTRDGVPWETAQPSTPGRFAVVSRNLVVYPPPDADTIDGSPYLALFYLANSPGMQPLGVPGITDNDMLTAIYDAALVLDGQVTPQSDAEAKAQQKRQAINQSLYARHKETALRDWESPAPLHKPRMSMGGRWARWTR